VRIAANEPWLAKAPMDLGALGINFPMICNRADAEKAVRSLRYPPRGDRLWGPFHAPFRWGVSMAHYMARADDDVLCMVTIEHVEAVNRIDEIMAMPGIDVAVIGPGDLATSINKRGQIDDPEVQALMKRAEQGILKSGVPIGGVARTAEQANQMIDRWRSASTGRCSSAASPRAWRESGAEARFSSSDCAARVTAELGGTP
jgi:4-hydroxy-2-oxoheptanedioate aldolase